MPVEITETHARAEGVEALLRASHRLMEALFPPEHNSYLDFEALSDPRITLWAARDAGQTLGTIALLRADGYGEVKSLFVDEAARGQRVAQRLLDHLEATARAEGIALLRLETGDLLRAAARLYLRAGYVQRGPFAAYEENGTSVFYEKRLIPSDRTG